MRCSRHRFLTINLDHYCGKSDVIYSGFHECLLNTSLILILLYNTVFQLRKCHIPPGYSHLAFSIGNLFSPLIFHSDVSNTTFRYFHLLGLVSVDNCKVPIIERIGHI